jgi:glutaredoxin
MIQEIERYLNAGVLREKIHVTYNPSVCKWSHRKARVLDSTDESFDVVKDKKGNLSADFSKMVLVSLQPHKSLDVKKINNSNGIIITIYNGLYYRFGFIPKQ